MDFCPGLLLFNSIPFDDFVAVGPVAIFDEPGARGVVKVPGFEGVLEGFPFEVIVAGVKAGA
jgi:hypothetical protein